MKDSIRPLHYFIHIEPDLQTLTFSGRVRLDLHADSPIGQVSLDACDLDIVSCSIERQNVKEECAFHLNPVQQKAILQFHEAIRGHFSLFLTYRGIVSNQYAGLYRSRYYRDGMERSILSTQFEARDARRTFPCFDEPGMKATFDIELMIPASLTGIANTQVIKETLIENDRKLIRFARTPRLSTYLVFFAIGEFVFLEDNSAKPLIRVATTPGKTEYGRFALDMARKALHFGEEYTDIPYPIDKCDFIAIPDSIGAMENFGAIRHSEEDLLVYPGVTSRPRTILTAKIIAHEAIHMWFGDLVSPSTWKHLWLNEAFATYFTYMIPHALHPEWQVWEQFFSERMLTGLERDSLDSSIPIDLKGSDDPDIDPAPTPSTAPIVYNKGASVLRMLTAYLGEQQFKQAIHDYLTKFRYDSASSEQFWEVIESTTGKPVTDFASKWIHQPGYPLITVEHQGQTLLLTQKRFSYRDGSDVNELWVIPLEILFFLQDGTTHSTRIDFSERSIKVPLPRDLLAYKLNLGFSGFYRVHYPDSNLEQLGALIHEKRLSEIDSLNVLSDLFSLVKAGKYSIEAYLSFVETHLAREERPLPLVELCSQLSHIYRAVKSWRSAISHLAIPLFEQALEMIGYQPATSESILITELRTALLQSALLVGSVKVLEFGNNKFQTLLDGNLLSNDLMPVVLKIGAATHPQAQAWLTARVTDPNLPEGERGMALDALGNSCRMADLLAALELNLLDRIPRSLRKRLWIETARNPACSDWIWSWTLQHLSQFESLPLSHLTVVLVNMIPIIGIGHRSEVECCLKEIGSHIPNIVDSLQMALEILEVNEKMNIPK